MKLEVDDVIIYKDLDMAIKIKGVSKDEIYFEFISGYRRGLTGTTSIDALGHDLKQGLAFLHPKSMLRRRLKNG